MNGFNRLTNSVFSTIFLACAGAFIASPAAAQDKFPSKPVTIAVGFAPGGSTDQIIRAMAKAAEKSLGQSVVVINKPGAGGTVALSNLTAQKADGYNLATITTGAVTAQYTRDMPFKVTHDFTPITEVVHMPSALVVRSDSPWKTLKDFVEHAKQNPKKVSYSTAGVGLSQHLAMEKLALEAGIDVVHAPYKGGMEAVTALLGGHVQALSQPPEWKPYVDNGTLRVLAVYGDKRMPQYPNIPTLKEQGYNFSMSAFISVVGPKGVPPERAKILADAFRKALDDPDFKTVLDTYFMSAVLNDSETFAKNLIAIDADMKTLVEKAGLRKAH